LAKPIEQKITTIALRSDHAKPALRELPRPQPLEEDEYYQKLEQIIARDFFPDNFDFKNQDHIKMGLDEFQRRYTSEDNASFQKLHE